jgi:hypothetical protein
VKNQTPRKQKGHVLSDPAVKPASGLDDLGNSISKRLQRRLLIFQDVEQFIQLCDFKHFINVVGDVAHNQFTAARLNFLVQGYEFTQSGAGKILDIGEIQENFFSAQFIHEAEQIFADFLDVLFVQDFFVDEINNGNFAVIFDFQSPAPILC